MNKDFKAVETEVKPKVRGLWKKDVKKFPGLYKKAGRMVKRRKLDRSC